MEPSNIGKENIKDLNDKLIAAVKVSDIKRVEGLLDSGAAVGHMDFTGSSPVYYACAEGNVEMLRVLVSRGARIDQNCSRMYTPLHYAVSQNNEEIVMFLLQKKGTVNIKDEFGATPLHQACKAPAVGVIKMLLAHGADVNCTDMAGRTALHYICDSSLGESDDDNTEIEDGLSYPSEEMRCEIIQLLLQKGADINSKGKTMMTPLHYAAREGHSGIIKLLLEKGADVDSRNDYGLTALHLASKRGHASAVKVLVEGGADVNAVRLKKGKTPLAYACYFLANFPDIYLGADHRSCREILERQIIKLKCLNYYVCKENISLVSSSEGVRDFLSSCENEVFKLKSHFLYSKIYFYNFLTKDENQLAIYTKNVSVMRAIKELQIRDIYPIYGGMIEENIKKGQRRLTLLKEGEKCLIELLSNKLPLLFVSDVLTYLGNEDLHSLVASCQPDSELI